MISAKLFRGLRRIENSAISRGVGSNPVVINEREENAITKLVDMKKKIEEFSTTISKTSKRLTGNFDSRVFFAFSQKLRLMLLNVKKH